MYDLWRMDAINELQAHNARKQALVNIPSRIAELEAAAAAIRSSAADGVPVKGGGSGREDMLLNNIVMRQKLERNLASAREAVQRVEQSLALLSGADQMILEYFFITPREGAVVQLSSKLGIERKTVYNRRDSALRLFQIALSGDS